jgi:hypothetical protein
MNDPYWKFKLHIYPKRFEFKSYFIGYDWRALGRYCLGIADCNFSPVLPKILVNAKCNHAEGFKINRILSEFDLARCTWIHLKVLPALRSPRRFERNCMK